MATYCKKLLSKETDGRVETRNKKPWVSAQGHKPSDSAESADGKSDISILAEPPNLYKQDGAPMSEGGFLAIAKSLFENEYFLESNPIYRSILIQMLNLSDHPDREMDHLGLTVLVKRWQLFYSIRTLATKIHR